MPCAGKPDCPSTLDAGMAQLTVGLVWHDDKYADEQEPQQRGQYEFAEEEARAKKVELWRDAKPVPPWEWRMPSSGSHCVIWSGWTSHGWASLARVRPSGPPVPRWP